jgi:hypothetical protein
MEEKVAAAGTARCERLHTSDSGAKHRACRSACLLG